MRARGAVTAAVLGLCLALGACSGEGGAGDGTPPKPTAPPPSAKPSPPATPSPSATPSAPQEPTPSPTPSRVRITPGIGGGSPKPYRSASSGGVDKKAAAEPQNRYAGPNPPPAPPRPSPTPEMPPPYTPGDDVLVIPAPTFDVPAFTPDTVR